LKKKGLIEKKSVAGRRQRRREVKNEKREGNGRVVIRNSQIFNDKNGRDFSSSSSSSSSWS